MPELHEIRARLITELLRIPVTATFLGRSSLIQDLPPVALNRSQENARLDLTQIFAELVTLGRLDKGRGARPLIVLVESAIEALGAPGSEIDTNLHDIRRDLEAYYGEVAQPDLPPPSPEDLEALIFGQQRDTRVAVDFLEQAVLTGRSVARLWVPRIFDGQPDLRPGLGGMFGTGWIVGQGLMLTNHHVVEARDQRPKPPGLGESPAKISDIHLQVAGIVARFDYYREGSSTFKEVVGATLLAYDEDLDYALIELAVPSAIEGRNPLRIVKAQPDLQRGSRLNIAQHPRGGAMQYAVRNNFYVRPGKSGSWIRYQTDTEPGASGSPVCDDAWQVIGLHHASVAIDPESVPQEVLDGQPTTVKLLNEAATIHAILAHLPAPLRSRIVGDGQSP